MITVLYASVVILKNTMAKGVFFLIDVEHDGDVQHCKSLIIVNPKIRQQR